MMNAKYILQNLPGFDTLSLSSNYENNGTISILQIDPLNYGLFVYSVQSYRISFFKLSISESICLFNEDFLFSSTNRKPETKPIEIYLLNVFCLPFPLLTVVCTKRNVWAVGKEGVLNLTPFVEQALIKAKSYENDDAMDVDVIEEFQPNMLDITLTVSFSKRYNLHVSDMFFGCPFLDCGLIRCHENSSLSRWELEFLLSNDRIMSSDVVALSFLDFPLSVNTSSLNITPNQDQNEAYKPLVVFIHHSDPVSCMFKNLFGINCVSPNVICLIGHVDGKLLWSLCDSSNQFQASHELQVLFNLKQPVVGIFFTKDIEGLEGCDCMLLVGALGQITLISSKCYPSFIKDSGCYTFWTKTVYISSSIFYCDILNDCLLYISNNGTLSLLSLSVIFRPSDKCEEVNSSSLFSEFECIEQMLVADRNKGLIFLKTRYGNFYLTQLKKSLESETVTASLPSLMNECLKQSNKMQKLLNKKVLQNRLFAAISTFASLKFLKNTLKEPITFSISEVNEEPRKYILVINLKCLDNLNLDPELCYATATAFTFFKNSNCFITKSAPYIVDEPTLCLEFVDTVLQPPFVSVFPLLVEVGLILQLPENWKTIDCFKPISSFLPFYICIQTFMVHELNLLQYNALCFPQSLKLETPKTLKMIKEMGMRRPVSNILQLNPKRDFNLSKKFSLCLSKSSVEEMIKMTSDSDPCKYIEKLLLGNVFENSMFKESYLMSKYSPISINVSKNNSHLVITLTANNSESLIGLRIAVMETLLATSGKSKQSTSSSTYVNIPASIYRRCEEISKSLMSLYGKDVESDEITCKIINLYTELRTDVSGKLPIL